MLRKFLNHCLPRAIRKIKHLALGLDGNIASPRAIIAISASCLMLYFPYSTRGNDLIITHTHTHIASNLCYETAYADIRVKLCWHLNMEGYHRHAVTFYSYQSMSIQIYNYE